ncbi:hypothetical protein LTR56_019299 [Elasticomyces elasticus]|nr:hypothetical protein LTR56_019299 [Elasticomyces elasticus]KAK3635312.1 hypothetical protein LTR22_019240 [Elasticomyces elasticus]KAK4931647.1 hypothetical protein LTR49_002039 [Elasticomyces elasticus]KAK5749475.1 hypothetical protein LTS12_020468 [Elasticomyces elasticus]
MAFTAIFSILPLLILSTSALQCVTSSYELCVVPGSQVDSTLNSGAVSGTYDPSSATAGFMANVGTMSANAATPARRGLSKRQQDLTSMCCIPGVEQCMYVGDLAYCYTPDTTRLSFPDHSYGFDSNSTFYDVDGTVVDFKNGIYQYPNGTTENFTPEEDASSSSGDSSSHSGGGSTASSNLSPVSTNSSQASTKAASGASTSATAASASGSQVASTVASGALVSNAFLGRTVVGAVGILGLLVWM